MTPRRCSARHALFVGLALALGAVISLDGQTPKPPMPYEDVGACPFEGCVYRTWTAKAAIPVRTDRRAAAPVMFVLGLGEQVTAVTGVVVTVKPGRVEFPTAVTLSSASGSVTIAPGQTLYLLTYRGEGFFKAWFEGRLNDQLDGTRFYNGVCDVRPERCTGQIVERTESVWWVQVRNRRGQTGWTSDVEQFDGKDRWGK